MYQKYKEGFSLEAVGKMYGMTRQSVHIGFRRRDYKLRKKEPLPFLSFNGNKYTLRSNGYYGMTYGKRSMMHRDVWEHYKGKIPPNYDVHHLNKNREDNRIENLELLKKADHTKKHYENDRKA